TGAHGGPPDPASRRDGDRLRRRLYNGAGGPSRISRPRAAAPRAGRRSGRSPRRRRDEFLSGPPPAVAQEGTDDDRDPDLDLAARRAGLWSSARAARRAGAGPGSGLGLAATA